MQRKVISDYERMLHPNIDLALSVEACHLLGIGPYQRIVVYYDPALMAVVCEYE